MEIEKWVRTVVSLLPARDVMDHSLYPPRWIETLTPEGE
jgi:hypothetical protein